MNRTFAILINYINLISALWISFVLIYANYSLVEIPYFVFFISFTIEIFTDKKWKNLTVNRKSIYFIVMFIFFLLAIISLPLEKTDKYAQLLLEKRLSILGFAIVGFFGVNRLYKLKYFLYTFIITSVLAICYIILYKIGLIDFLKSQDRVELFKTTRILYVNGHMIFNFYLNISILSTWYIIKNNWSNLSKLSRYLFIATLTLTLGTLSFTEGRSGFTSGLLLFLFIIFTELYRRRKIIGIVFVFILPLLFVGLASNQKRISENMFKAEPRLFLWKAGLNVAKESPIWGLGISAAQEEFDKERSLNQTVEFRDYSKQFSHVDCHNQYIQTTMEFGILGLAALLFLYFYPIFISDKARRKFTIFVIFLCVYQSIFDMFITGPFSPIFGILTLMMLAIEPEKDEEETDNVIPLV